MHSVLISMKTERDDVKKVALETLKKKQWALKKIYKNWRPQEKNFVKSKSNNLQIYPDVKAVIKMLYEYKSTIPMEHNKCQICV